MMIIGIAALVAALAILYVGLTAINEWRWGHTAVLLGAVILGCAVVGGLLAVAAYSFFVW